jgi:hypothetical protein
MMVTMLLFLLIGDAVVACDRTEDLGMKESSHHLLLSQRSDARDSTLIGQIMSEAYSSDVIWPITVE